MRFENLKGYLIDGKSEPCYCVRGADEYLREKAVEMLSAFAQPFLDFNLANLTKPDVQTIMDTASVCTMGGARVLIVRGAEIKGQQNLKALKQFVHDGAFGAHIVFVEPNDELYKALAGLALTIECDGMSIPMLIKWINREFSTNNRKISEQNARLLIEMCDGKMSRLNLEVQKLLFAGDNEEISTHDIEELVETSIEYKVFALSDCVVNGEKNKALKIMYYLLADKSEPLMLLSLLYNCFRRIMYCSLSSCSTAELAAYLSVKEYAITVAQRQAKKFNPRRLATILRDLGDTEYAVKSGALKGEDCIQLSILKILDSE